MTYDLAIGDRAYSSWSLRGWLLFDAFGIPVQTETARLYTDELPQLLTALLPRRAPCRRCARPRAAWCPKASPLPRNWPARHPEAGIWPQIPTRPRHGPGSGGGNARGFYRAAQPLPDEPARQLHRLRPAGRGSGRSGPAGSDLGLGARRDRGKRRLALRRLFSAADAFFAPVATRIASYNLPVGPQAAAYVAAHLAHPSFRRWRAMGLVDGADQDFYRRDYPRRPWPGPRPPARNGRWRKAASENAACPYSGKPVTHVLELDGRRFGFCNAFCRDKTVADPEAWPKFMAVYQS